MNTINDQYTRLNQLSFLPEPPLKVTYPNPNTLDGKCLSRLLNGEIITHIDAINETDSWRLAANIHNLKRKHGWPIESYKRAAPSSEVPNRYISYYFLPQKVIEDVLGLAGKVKATHAKNGIN